MKEFQVYEATISKGKERSKKVYGLERAESVEIGQIEADIQNKIQEILSSEANKNLSIQEIIILIEQELSEHGFIKLRGIKEGKANVSPRKEMNFVFA